MRIFRWFVKKTDPQKLEFNKLKDWIKLKEERKTKEDMIKRIKDELFSLSINLKKIIKDLKNINLDEKNQN